MGRRLRHPGVTSPVDLRSPGVDDHGRDGGWGHLPSPDMASLNSTATPRCGWARVSLLTRGTLPRMGGPLPPVAWRWGKRGD